MIISLHTVSYDGIRAGSEYESIPIRFINYAKHFGISLALHETRMYRGYIGGCINVENTRKINYLNINVNLNV